jgi:hypothetical protein
VNSYANVFSESPRGEWSARCGGLGYCETPPSSSYDPVRSSAFPTILRRDDFIIVTIINFIIIIIIIASVMAARRVQ